MVGMVTAFAGSRKKSGRQALRHPQKVWTGGILAEAIRRLLQRAARLQKRLRNT
jgi:hypothetical protein